ncbi:MAG: hypothetical protein J6A46_03940 [Clostridia bacterium]|nr:hypothetical protein [Clostridia bacterium]
MKRNQNEPVKVMNGKPFVAAYSNRPFEEGMSAQGVLFKTLKWDDQTTIPDYQCYYDENTSKYWCVRVGDIDVPWGFGADENGYWANGLLSFSRKNMSEETFDGKGLPFERVGDVYYLYECELGDGGFYGFSVYIRDKMLDFLKQLAWRTSKEEFRKMIENNGVQTLMRIPKVRAFLNEHQLKLKGVVLHGIGIEEKKE